MVATDCDTPVAEMGPTKAEERHGEEAQVKHGKKEVSPPQKEISTFAFESKFPQQP